MSSLHYQHAVIEYDSANVDIVNGKVQVTIKLTAEQQTAIRQLLYAGVIDAWPGTLVIGDQALEDVVMEANGDTIIFTN